MKGDAHKALHNQTGDTNPNWNKCKNKKEWLQSQKKRGGPDAILDRSSSNTFLVLLSSQRPIFLPCMKRGITSGYLFHHNATQTYANGMEVTCMENLKNSPTQGDYKVDSRQNSLSFTTRVLRIKVNDSDLGQDPNAKKFFLKRAG